MAQYKNSIKKKLCELICLNGKSTIKTAVEFNVPLKTLEKWITAYHKNNHCFDEDVLYNDFHIISDSPINNNNDINYDEYLMMNLKPY